MSRILVLIRVFRLAIILAIAFIIAACQPAPAASTPTQQHLPPTSTHPAVPATGLPLEPLTVCNGTETAEAIPPQLKEVDPNPAAPGEEITLKGSGGYTRCGSAYFESSRNFQLYFDDQPVTQITCYANHCETKLTVPMDAASGEHAIKVEGGSQIKLKVSQP